MAIKFSVLGSTPITFTAQASGIPAVSPVTSVNGKVGAVVLDYEDVGALPDTTDIPTKTSDLTNDGDGTNPFLTQHQSLSAYRTSANQDIIDATKQDAPTIKTVMDAVATVNTQYYLGTQTSVTVTLPSTASAGQQISVVFYSGSTATTLSVSGTTIGTVPTPAVNQRVELSILYDGTYWAVLSNVMAVSV